LTGESISGAATLSLDYAALDAKYAKADAVSGAGVTRVNAGQGLSGGGTGDATVNVDYNQLDTRYLTKPANIEVSTPTRRGTSAAPSVS
jgi:hypothetical protein